MDRGYSMLGSGMLTQSQILSGASNNLANINTTGFKKEQITSSTFGSMIMQRMDSSKAEIGSVTLMKVVDDTRIIASQGTLDETGRTLDFAIEGEGFFGVRTGSGTAYTRDGSFSVNTDGYLTTDGGDLVLGQNGPIKIGTSDFTADSSGNLYVNGTRVDSIAVYNFNDYTKLSTDGDGLYVSSEQPALAQSPTILWQTLEGSNVDATEEMTNAISAQRQLQSCSQALKMVDETLEKAVTDIAKI